ncbi:MAG: AgmX/PglI C-terminal domain-containing protein [Gemmatimonadaceae bacterium]
MKYSTLFVISAAGSLSLAACVTRPSSDTTLPASALTATHGSSNVAPPRPTQMRDHGELRGIVRGYDAQLNFCYEEARRVDPTLAGTATVVITIAGSGNVTDVTVTERSWKGEGAREAESCIGSKIRAWHFPSSEEILGTYAFSFNFTS